MWVQIGKKQEISRNILIGQWVSNYLEETVLGSFPDSRLFPCQFLLPMADRVPFMKYKSDYVSTLL